MRSLFVKHDKREIEVVAFRWFVMWCISFALYVYTYRGFQVAWIKEAALGVTLGTGLMIFVWSWGRGYFGEFGEGIRLIELFSWRMVAYYALVSAAFGWLSVHVPPGKDNITLPCLGLLGLWIHLSATQVYIVQLEKIVASRRTDTE
jgi:hypothetical protein